MAKKQTATKNNNDGSGEEQKLVVKVDQMMATEHQDMTPNYEPATKITDPDPKAKKVEVKDEVTTTENSESSEPVSPPALDIFADVPGPPPLAGKSEAKASPPKKATQIAVVDNSDDAPTNQEEKAEVETEAEPEEEAETEADIEDEAEAPSATSAVRTENFDDPVIAEAIEDIVAHEGDIALSVQDATQADAELKSLHHAEAHTHHLFWTLVAIVCLVAIAMAVFIINPSIHTPFRNLHWNTIRRHL